MSVGRSRVLLGLFVVCCLSGSLAEDFWPLPQEINMTSETYFMNAADFNFNATGYQSETLTGAFARYSAIIFSATEGIYTPESTYHKYSSPTGTFSSLSTILGVNVNVLTANMTLGLDTDESYYLVVQSPYISITAPTVYGAMWGLETLSQMCAATGKGGIMINGTSIYDYPRFPHRGILIDSSRHYLPLGVILANIDAMAYNKMNVLHWHIVDDESFPFESSTYPLLSEKGAYNAYKQIYTHEDVQTVVAYAMARGVRVVPEFDTPGHTLSWGKGYEFLLTPCYGRNGQLNGEFGPMYPIEENVYEFVSNLFKEVSGLFPDAYMHIGGDEVNFTCWQSNPDVTAFMEKMGYGDNYDLLENYYVTQILATHTVTQKDYIVWEEVFDNGVKISPQTVVEVWKPGWPQTLANVVNAGFRGILSTPWYLNYIAYGDVWVNYYAIEPTDIVASAEAKKLIMGGEACMWGEYVDGTNLISRLWPMAGAISERLWSAIDVTDVDAAVPRLGAQRCRLVARGISAEPPSGPSFCTPEYDPVYTPPWST